TEVVGGGLRAGRHRRGDRRGGPAKGLIEPGVVPRDTGVRGVREEAGLEAEIEEDLGEISYFYVWEGVRVRKAVRFFLMRATGGDVSEHDHEMEEVRWFGLPGAISSASFKSERDVLEKAAALLGRGAGGPAP